MRIWADMSAPAHVLVLRPIIERLRERGHEVIVTSREYTQTQELLALHGMEHPTLEKAWRASEPHTPHPRKRIEAVAELNRAGIPTGVLIPPLMPDINDSPKQVEEILDAALVSMRSACGSRKFKRCGHVGHVPGAALLNPC
jgi:DNA repair photolyase